MKLLDLGAGRVSLEFAPADWAEIRAGLAAFGAVSTERHGTCDVLHVGDADLVRVDEWDEPCLIADTPGGISILAAIANAGPEQVAAE